jgi:UDP-3-O-acyl N-acetylglucosamine deacetylase
MQNTLGKEFSVAGIGVFSGKNTGFIAKPAEPSTGIIFKVGNELIPVDIDYVKEAPNRTILAKDSISVQVVEHLVSALRGMGVDNALIEVENDEIPIIDASAREYVHQIQLAGIEEDDKSILLLPDSQIRITYFLDHPHPNIRRLSDSMILNADNYGDFIGPARTFATRQEAESLISRGIVGTDDKTLVIIIDDDGFNQELRHPLEFVHHKMLDMIGDISLAYWPIIGHIIGIRSGHFMNRKFARKLRELSKNI